MKRVKLITSETNNEDRIERKHFEYLMDACQKLSIQCDKKDLKVFNVKFQPHHTTVFKLIRTHLETILNTDSSKNLDNLNKIEFLLCMKNEIYKLFSDFSSYVAQNGIIIGQTNSMQRSRFFQTIVHYQFLALELLDYFPSGNYRPEHVKIAKPEAKAWWASKFQNKIYVNRQEFMSILSQEFNLVNKAESLSFESCINFTKTSFVTTFEFDLITRLYAPWETFIEVWRTIFHHPAYLHFSTYSETRETLSKHLNKVGTYVFRVSCKDLGCWTIGYVKATKEIGQLKVDRSNLIETLVEGKKKNMYLYPNGNEEDRELKNFTQYRKEIVVSKDDLDLYASFDDYKECKICREAEKNLQMESCGHQICETCFSMLKKYDKRLCPFCNQPIKSTTKINNIREPTRDTYLEPSKNKPSDDPYVDCELNEVEGEEESLYTETTISNGSPHFPPPPRTIVVPPLPPMSNGSNLNGPPVPPLPKNTSIKHTNAKVEYPIAFLGASNDPPAVPPLPVDISPNLNRNPSSSSSHINMRSNSSDEYSKILKSPIQNPYGASKDGPPLPPLPKQMTTNDEEVYIELDCPDEAKPNPFETVNDLNINENVKKEDMERNNLDSINDDDIYKSFGESEDDEEQSQSDVDLKTQNSPILNGKLNQPQYVAETTDEIKRPLPKPRKGRKIIDLQPSPNEDLYSDHFELVNNQNNMSNTFESDNYFEGKWTQDFIERALKVANGDKSLAKNILLEFITPISDSH